VYTSIFRGHSEFQPNSADMDTPEHAVEFGDAFAIRQVESVGVAKAEGTRRDEVKAPTGKTIVSRRAPQM
jgi:hypothetical protein